ncbi:unnamed protein product, partial [Rotaria sp. Silwood1]
MDKNFAHAHGTAMVMSCMVLTSTGILLARYGRTLRFGARRQLLGKAIWYAGGQWVSSSVPNPRLFVHSVVG